MKKISKSKFYIIFCAIIFCIAIAFIIRFLFISREVRAFVSSLEVFQNEPLVYSDSTLNAKKWLWEFGNGDMDTVKYGSYTYKNTGTYQLRLTVDNSLQKEFIIQVKDPVRLERDSLIQINAPDFAIQDAYIIFRGIGISKEWRWSFGASGIIDSREKSAIYTYDQPGIYEVELTTEDTKYPVKHLIEIFPKYMDNDTTDVLKMIGNDIREKLQAIVDGKPFNPNYNHIMTRYLCENPNVMVTINNDKRNDFYSYCQGLKILGKKSITINDVIVIQDENSTECVQKLIVSQYSYDD